MRLPALVLAVLGLASCRRGTLEDDAGTGGFTLDGAGPGGDAGGATDAADLPDVPFPTADANCGHISNVASYLNPDILVVLDRSISVNPTQWNAFLSSLTGTISTDNELVDWGLYAFPQNGPACGPGTVTTAIDVSIMPSSAMHVIAHLVAAGTGASGTPTAAAIQTAVAYMQSLTDQNPKFLMLVTDGAPTCAGTIDGLSADPAQAQADAVAAINAAYAAGFPTFVVAPSTTTATGDVDALNALATAGRYPQPPPGPRFFTELTIGPLLTSTDSNTSCPFSLGADPPPVPDVVTVTFNDVPIPRDRSHTFGWDYTSPDMRAIALFGSWCEMVVSRRSFTVNVYFGCPNPG